VATAVALLAGATSATATEQAENPNAAIEGVWSFSGGRVAIQAGPGGALEGIVLSPINFEHCDHPVGEAMWTGLSRRSNGSYWGLHQWFSGDGSCTPVQPLGKSAWRVMGEPGGERLLKVCLSSPENAVQPRIKPDGEVRSASYGCFESARISGLPEGSLKRYLTLPRLRPGTCVSRGKLRIRIRDWDSDPVDHVEVTLRSSHHVHRRAKLVERHARIFAVLNLRGLPAGAFRVKVKLSTVLGHRYTSKRTYRRCAAHKKRKRHAHGRA
jgi:hypothetical protein